MTATKPQSPTKSPNAREATNSAGAAGAPSFAGDAIVAILQFRTMATIRRQAGSYAAE